MGAIVGWGTSLLIRVTGWLIRVTGWLVCWSVMEDIPALLEYWLGFIMGCDELALFACLEAQTIGMLLALGRGDT